MTDIRKHISTLTMPEKVELFNDLYGELSGYGTEGDTELAHVNTFEVGLLKSVGGSGTINEITGLVQFGGGGTPPPAQTTVNQQASFPKELRPFVEDVLTQGQAEYERQATEGYQRFGGPQLADFSPEQLAAQDLGRQQFTGLAGTALADPRTYYQPALAATALGTAEIGTEDIQRRMDPFLQNVVDVAKRETRRDEELAQQGRGAQAVGAGSFGGSRHAIVEAEAERNLGQRLGDIQSRGLSAAFQNAQQAAEAQRAREMAGGRQFAALGDITGARARSDLAGLTGIGEVGQQREQQALDIAQREFREEKAFPQTNLQQYSALIRGFPLQASQQRFAQETLPTPSLAQTLAGGVGTAASLYGAFGGFGGNKEGGLVGLQGGGQPMMGPQMQQQPNAMMQQQPNEMDTLEMLRQRGAAIRGLSEPTNRSSGGIVNKSIGSILRQTKGGAKSMDLAGDFGSAVRDKDSKGLLRMMLRNNPKLLKKLGVGAGSSGRKTSYAEFNPGTAGSQYAEGGIVSLATSGNPTNANLYTGSGSGSQRQGLLKQQAIAREQELARLRAMQDRSYPTGDLSKREALADRIKEQSEKYEQRQAQLDERRQQAQWGNLGKFFGRLSTDVSPAAQQGGMRGLLGAVASAGAPSVDEVLATEEDYYGREMDLADQVAAAEIAGLEAEAGIEETQYGRGKDRATYELSVKEVEGKIASWEAAAADDPAKANLVPKITNYLATALGAQVIDSEAGIFTGGAAIDKYSQAWANTIMSDAIQAAIDSGKSELEAFGYAKAAIDEELIKYDLQHEQNLPAP